MSASNSTRLLFEAESVTIRGRRFVPLISPEEIDRAVERVAAVIAASDVVHPLFLCVLKGGAFFLADLVRRIPLPATIAFVRSTSYGEGMRSSGAPTFTEDAGTDVEGRDVIIVEDIVDTGVTVAQLRTRLMERGAGSVRTGASSTAARGGGADARIIRFISRSFGIAYDSTTRGRELFRLNSRGAPGAGRNHQTGNLEAHLPD